MFGFCLVFECGVVCTCWLWSLTVRVGRCLWWFWLRTGVLWVCGMVALGLLAVCL